MQSIDKVRFCVQPIVFDRFGVFADAVLIAIHFDQAGAQALCQRLRDQQATDVQHPLRRHTDQR